MIRKSSRMGIYWILGLAIVVIYQEKSMANPGAGGFRIGVQGGYGLIDSKVKITNTETVPNSTDSSDVGGRGVIGGIILDFSTLVGNTDTYMGLEAALNIATTKGKKSTIGTFISGGNGADLSTTVQFRRALEFIGKLGYLVKNSALPYIKAGASMGHWKAYTTSNSANASGAGSVNSLGIVAGIGVEFPMGDRLSWGAEYNYRYYKNLSHILYDNTTKLPLRTISVSPSAHAIMLRLNYLLSGTDFSPEPPPKKINRKRSKKSVSGG